MSVLICVLMHICCTKLSQGLFCLLSSELNEGEEDANALAAAAVMQPVAEAVWEAAKAKKEDPPLRFMVGGDVSNEVIRLQPDLFKRVPVFSSGGSAISPVEFHILVCPRRWWTSIL